MARLINALRESSVLVRLSFDVGKQYTNSKKVTPSKLALLELISKLIQMLGIVSEELTRKAISKFGMNSRFSVLKKASRLQVICLDNFES